MLSLRRVTNNNNDNGNGNGNDNDSDSDNDNVMIITTLFNEGNTFQSSTEKPVALTS